MENKGNSSVSAIFKLFQIAWKEERFYFVYLLFNFFFSGMYTYSLISIPKLVLELLGSGSTNFQSLFVYFFLLAIGGIGAAIMRYFYTPCGYRIRYRLLLKSMEHTLSIPLSDYENPKYLDNMWQVNRPLSGITGIQAFFLQFGHFCGNIAVVLVSVFLLIDINIWIALLVLLWTVIYMRISFSNNNKKEKNHHQFSRVYRESGYLADICGDSSYAKELRVFQLKEWIKRKIDSVNQRFEQLVSKLSKYDLLLELLNTIYQLVRDFFMYFILATLYFSNQITIAELSTYSVLVTQLNVSLEQLAFNVKSMLQEYYSFSLMFEYLAIEKESSEGISLPKSENWTIQFENVSFHYPGNTYEVYKNLNFTIEKGKKIAIIGLNGVGKTTLIKLLMRLYKPTSGRILFNGIDIESIQLKEYYQLFAPVFQEINLFPFTFLENLVFDSEDNIDIVELEQILEQVGLLNKYQNLPNGMQTNMTRYIEEDGVLLSGGESQKFVLARALTYHRDVLILDEPTSALDAIAEYEFYEKINTEFKDKTILFISHRLASTSFCDHIVLIEDQSILEQGTHEQLMKDQGRYSELFEIQAKNYKEEVAV